MAYYVRSLGPGLTVYFLAPPRMFYYGFPSVPFIARDAKGIDVAEPLGPASSPPSLQGPTLFVALPERSRELDRVRGIGPKKLASIAPFVKL
jgi:hypothetical protein